MKKFLFLLLFSIFSIFSKAQTNFYFGSSEYATWKVSGDAYCGIGNAYCIVYRSNGPNAYGNYVYNIYFASNSYDWNCQYTRTYIPDIYIYSWDNYTKKYYLPLNYFTFWMNVGETTLAYTLFHPNPNLFLRISVGKMEPSYY